MHRRQLCLVLVCLTCAPAVAQTGESKSIEEIKREFLSRPTRAIQVLGKEQLLEEKKTLPKVDIRVQFGFNSEVLTQEGREALVPLAKAMQDPELSTEKFLVGGHTDAKGGDEYNDRLSERRARAVRDHLLFAHRISPERLVTMGFGKRELTDREHPEDAVNRRVEIIVLGANSKVSEPAPKAGR